MATKKKTIKKKGTRKACKPKQSKALTATQKQKKLADLIVENMRKRGKRKSMGALMKEAGYSDSMASHPKQVTTSKNFISIIENAGVTDDKLGERMNEGLDAMKVISANIVQIKSNDPTVKDKEAHAKTMDFIDVPDYGIRHKYLETALKIKGHHEVEDDLSGGLTLVIRRAKGRGSDD